MTRFVVVSGCSGGGKSTLLAELKRRGYTVVEEPGRRIVLAETRANGSVLPWADPTAFLHRAVAMALEDRAAIESGGRSDGWVFFDRGLIDAAAGLQYLSGEPLLANLGQLHRYHQRVFLTPPWPETYAQDPERRHSLKDAGEHQFTRHHMRIYDHWQFDDVSFAADAKAEKKGLAGSRHEYRQDIGRGTPADPNPS